MLPIERRKEIMAILRREGSVKAEELARHYEVGVPTIRRDLKYLAQNQGVSLMYGGAYIAENSQETIKELNIVSKQHEHVEEKRMIAKKAAALIRDGETIALNSGSTVEFILDYIDESITNINVLTLSINVAVKARTLPNVTVYMPGGKLRSISGAFIGSSANEFISQFNIDKAFMGVLAVSMKKGVTHSSLDEIITNKTLASVSNHCYMVADYSKFDKVSMANMFDLEIFEAFIVDDKIPKKYLEYAKNNDIEII